MNQKLIDTCKLVKRHKKVFAEWQDLSKKRTNKTDAKMRYFSENMLGSCNRQKIFEYTQFNKLV